MVFLVVYLDDNNGLFIGDNGYLCSSFLVVESFLFVWFRVLCDCFVA